MYDLVPQTQLLADIRAAMRDPSAARWTTAEIFAAMNQALLKWRDKVSIPQKYAINFSDGTWNYTLPAYIQPPFRVLTIDNQVYHPASWTILPGEGGWELQFNQRPPKGDGFIIWNLRNGQLPTAAPTLQATINSTDTNIELNTIYADLPSSGYIRIENETILYTEHTITTRSNLTVAQRGVLSTAASHTSTTPVAWCVACPSAALRAVLMDETRLNMHEMYLTNAAPKERDHHQQMISYYTDKARQFWSTYYEPTAVGRIRPTVIDSGMTI